MLQAGLRYFVERLQDTRTPLWLYGAGHVGRALVRVLAELPFRITWVDSREDYLEDAMAQLAVAEQVEAQWTDDPAGMAAAAPAGAWHLVMTHSHAQDLDICAAVLARNHFGFAGLIGSRSKAARFRQRLSERGVPAAALARLVCPIGVAGIKSKLPTAVAVAAAAQLLQLREQHALAANEIAYGAMSR
ncbi:MAG: xanthine dehydrogenase accessory protein XdhC [Rhodocyclaceae bacterium]|nr:xanthine dehydrogenase accessory protein XdhC [Rhodocyclaceae bacterium]